MDEPLGSALSVSHALPFLATHGDPLHAAARGTKVFVLDTSVILYDGQSLKNFQEHDVAVPITVLEELDQFKKGNSVMNLQARQFIRQLDTLSGGNLLREWIPLNGATSGRVRVLPDDGQLPEAARVLGSDSNDHRILGAALRLREAEPGRRVILVSKDINLRLKARALNLLAEDYETISADSSLKLVPYQTGNVFYIGMNNTIKPFDNEKVRQAVAMAIDKQRIVDNFYPTGSYVAPYSVCPQ